VDWAFSVNGSLAFLVEAKAVGKKIDRYDEQLGDYYAKEHGGVKLGILTTGVKWRFCTDLDKENVMDNEPFLEWEVLKGAIPYDFLTILQRDKFNPDLIKTFAKGKRRQSVLVKELTRLLEPSDEFVKLAIQNKEMLFEDRNLTATVIQEWKPILASAIHEWAQQQRLTAVLEDQPVDPSRLVGKPGGIAKIGEPSGDERYIEFWEPIRREGLFKGKPAGGSWISKGCRGIWLHLAVYNHACLVDVRFSAEDRRERRSKAIELFPDAKYSHELRESEKCAYIRFPVLDKGIKDREHWPEIREKLKLLGENIYKTLRGSDV